MGNKKFTYYSSAKPIGYLDDFNPFMVFSVDKLISTATWGVEVGRRGANNIRVHVLFDGDYTTLDSPINVTAGSTLATNLGEFVAAPGYSNPDGIPSPSIAQVYRWNNQAGVGGLLITNPAEQATLVNSSGVLEDPVFDGNDYYFQDNPALLSALNNKTAASCFFRGKPFDTTTDMTIFLISFSGAPNGSGRYRLGVNFTDNRYRTAINRNVGGASQVYTSSTNHNANAMLLSSFVKYDNPSNVQQYENGVNTVSSTVTSEGAIAASDSWRITLGRAGNGALFYQGTLRSLVFFNTFELANRNIIETIVNK